MFGLIRYNVIVGGVRVARIRSMRAGEYQVDVTGAAGLVDPRLILACAVQKVSWRSDYLPSRGQPNVPGVGRSRTGVAMACRRSPCEYTPHRDPAAGQGGRKLRGFPPRPGARSGRASPQAGADQ